MGCCCSTEENIINDQDEPDERTVILRADAPINASHNSSVYSGPVINGTPVGAIASRNEGQDTLNNILDTTAREFIDVCTMEVENMEYQEQKSRSAYYRDRLQSCGASHVQNLHALPTGVSAPNAVLFAPTVSQVGLDEIHQMSHSMAQAVLSIEATGKDQLVVKLATCL